nr:AAA family ATPase [Actinospica robiniae]
MTLLDAPPAPHAPDTAPLPPEVARALAILRAHGLAEMPGAEADNAPDDAPNYPADEETGAQEDPAEHDGQEQPEPDDDNEEAEPEDEDEDTGPAPDPQPTPALPPAPASTAPASPAAPAVQGSSAPTGQAGAPGRSRPGELQDKVAHFLADEEGTEFTVTEVANRLGHSGGAVGNALETLAADRKITKTNGSPRTYKARHPTPYRPAPTAPRPAAPPRPPRAPAPPAPAPANTSPVNPAPATPAAPARTEKQDTAIRRRNGQLYYPRKLGEDLTDVQALHKLRDAGIPVLLEGPPGTGKTSLVEAAFPDLILVAGDGDTQVADLVGSYTMRADGGYEFVYGPLITAMTEGRPLFLDDATLISPKVLAAMYPAMDGRREIVVKEHRGETVTADEGFYVIAGHNPGVHGAILTEALASRFATRIQVGTDWELAVSLGVDGRAVQIARNLATRQAAGDLAWSPQLRELLAFKAIHEVLGEDAAFGNLVALAPAEDRDEVATVVRTILGKAASPLALGKQAKN